MTNGAHDHHPEGDVRRDEPRRVPPPRRRRKTLRHRFCDGIEAAVKAEPSAFATTKPRTMLGLMVRELVGAAARARCDAIRVVITFLDEAEVRRTAAEMNEADSQGKSGPDSLADPRWDWSEDGAWDSSEREPGHRNAEEAKKEDEDAEAKVEELRNRLYERFRRVADADRVNAERKARIEAERGCIDTPPRAGPVSDAQDPLSAGMRIGGRVVDG